VVCYSESGENCLKFKIGAGWKLVPRGISKSKSFHRSKVKGQRLAQFKSGSKVKGQRL